MTICVPGLKKALKISRGEVAPTTVGSWSSLSWGKAQELLAKKRYRLFSDRSNYVLAVDAPSVFYYPVNSLPSGALLQFNRQEGLVRLVINGLVMSPLRV